MLVDGFHLEGSPIQLMDDLYSRFVNIMCVLRNYLSSHDLRQVPGPLQSLLTGCLGYLCIDSKLILNTTGE